MPVWFTCACLMLIVAGIIFALYSEHQEPDPSVFSLIILLAVVGIVLIGYLVLNVIFIKSV